MNELYELLKELKRPLAYHHFIRVEEPPFVIYYRVASNNFMADDRVYEKINTYRVELYTEYKDLEMELKIENLLDQAGIIYEIISESYIESEKLYQVIYEISM